MINAQFSKHVASVESREGCPITPGASFTKQFYLVPLASCNKDRRGKETPCRKNEAVKSIRLPLATHPNDFFERSLR